MVDDGGPEVGQEALADMSAGDVLSFVERRHAARLAAERDILQAAYQWALLHHPDSLPAGDRRGRERARPAGAAGTPLITEHAAAAFGARIQTSPYGARRLIADAVDLAVRLPRLYAGIAAGTVRVAHARHVAAATRELSAEQAAWVDVEVSEVSDGRVPWARYELLIDGKVAAAGPELARARERAAATQRYARMSRVNRYGMASFTVHADAATVVGIDAAVTALAKRLAEAMPDAPPADRRIAALALLANPAAHADPSFDTDAGPVRPTAQIYLHLCADSAVGRLEGNGPVTIERVRELVGSAGRVKVTPVLDLAGQAPVDAYEIPARLREAVHLIHPADAFPFAAGLSRDVDLDHAVPYAEGGPTAVGNLAPLTRTHHRIKTHAGWTARQPFPGIVVWRDPYGAFYLVDPTGTRRVSGTTGGQELAPIDFGFSPFVLEIVAA